jgi:hypothetical protein
MSRLVSTSADEESYGGEAKYQPIGDKIRDHINTDNAIQLLKWVNFAGSILFLGQIIAYAAIEIHADAHPTVGKPRDCQHRLCRVDTDKLGEINVQFLFPVIMAIAYIHHLAFYMQCQLNDTRIRKWFFVLGGNPMRWMEYALTYSLVTVISGILVGVEDVHLWLLAFFNTALAMGLGSVIEMIPRATERPDIWPVSFRSLRRAVLWQMALLIALPWAVLLCYYARAVHAHLPAFVHVAFWGSFASFLVLAGNVVSHNILRRYDFITAELVHIAGSVLGKTVLGIAVYSGLHK